MTDARQVTALVDAEIAALDGATRANRLLLQDFARLRVRRPHPVTVQFSGGFFQTCWTVTRSDGAWSVLFMPQAGYFTLCADSDFGPLDIGVHGPALQVFDSVR